MGWLQDVFKNGVTHYGNEQPAYFIRKNGERDLAYFNFVYQPYHENDGTVSGVMVLATDVTEQVLARKKTEESEKRFRLLADSIPIHVFIMEPDDDVCINYWNKSWLDYTGQTIEEALGKTWNRIIHPNDIQTVIDTYQSAFEKRQSFMLPGIRVKRYDGMYRWHSVTANPRYLPSGDFIGYIGIGVDIHESKLTEDALKVSESHFRKMTDLMPAKISNANADGDVTYFNKHWLDFSGMDFKELKEFGYHQIMHPDEIAEFQQRFQKAAETGEDMEMEMRFKNAAGNYKWHLNIASPVKDEHGKIKMWVGVTTEIQKMKDEEERKGDFIKW
jgi:PAS domain S-box-containing protein